MFSVQCLAYIDNSSLFVFTNCTRQYSVTQVTGLNVTTDSCCCSSRLSITMHTMLILMRKSLELKSMRGLLVLKHVSFLPHGYVMLHLLLFGQGTSFLACSMHVLYKGCRIEMPLEKTMLRRKSWSNEEYIIVIICIRCDYGISVLCSACLFGVQISIACQINWL